MSTENFMIAEVQSILYLLILIWVFIFDANISFKKVN